jgi:soluble P-type ATPase
MFLLSRRDKDITSLNERIKKLKAIIESYAADDDTMEKLRCRNHKLLARLFQLSSDYNMSLRREKDFNDRLNKQKAVNEELMAQMAKNE